MVLSRRAVLAGTAASAVAWALRPLALLRAVAAPSGVPADPVADVLRVYVSTLVPGREDDPGRTPGAPEAGAVEQLQAQAPYVIAPLVADVTAAALAATGKPFTMLGYPQREALLVQAFADPLRAPYHLIALAVGAGAFYGDFRNRVGGDHLGFPGPSDGYLATYTDRTGHGQPEAEAVPG